MFNLVIYVSLLLVDCIIYVQGLGFELDFRTLVFFLKAGYSVGLAGTSEWPFKARAVLCMA